MKKIQLFIVLIISCCLIISCRNRNKSLTNINQEIPANTYDFQKSENLYTHLVGTIDNIPISMDIVYIKSTKEFSINYEYDAYQEPIYLVGSINQNRLCLKHFSSESGNLKETFYGSFNKDKSYTGNWYNEDSSKVLAFDLKESFKNSIPFQILNYDTVYYYIGKYQHEYSADYHYAYLTCNNTLVNNTIRTALIGKNDGIPETVNIKTSIINKVNNYYIKFKKDIDELTDMDDTSYHYSLSYEMGSTPEIIKNDADYLILNLSDYTYEGGAHGILYSSIICIDKKSNKQLFLNDIIKEFGENNLLNALNKQIRKDNGLKEDQDFTESDEGMFLIDKVEELPINFYITKNHIVFLFNDYELKAYVAGHQLVKIPIKTIK